MNEQEIADWEREITHAEMMSNARPLNILEHIKLKRETITFAGGKTYELPVKDDSDEK